MMYSALVFLLLMATWIFFSGMTDSFHVGLGIISCAFVTWMSSDLLFSNRKISLLDRLRQGVRLAMYSVWLVWQIVLANIQILKLVLSPNLKEQITPSIVKITTPLNTDFEKYLLANSITLTPGTVTVRISGNDLYIHSITKDSAEGLNSEMDRRISNIFGTQGNSSSHNKEETS